MRTATVTYCGVPMACSYEYTPAEPRMWDHPGSPADAALCECKVGGVDIFDLLTAAQAEDIETLILEEQGARDADDAAEAAWQRRQDRLMEEGA